MESQKFSDELKYYHKNAIQINKAVNLLDNFLNFIQSNIASVANELDHKVQHKKDYYSYIYKNNEDKVFYTILYHEVMDGKSTITILIEFWTKEITNLAKEIDEKFTDSELQEKGLKRYINNGGTTGSEWLHFLAKDYTLTMDNFEGLGKFISDNIKNDFADIMVKVLSLVNEAKSKQQPL